MGGIAPAELAAVRGRLEAFVDDIFESLPRKDQRARGACYLRGLMLEGRRKSIEPMAAAVKIVQARLVVIVLRGPDSSQRIEAVSGELDHELIERLRREQDPKIARVLERRRSERTRAINSVMAKGLGT